MYEANIGDPLQTRPGSLSLLERPKLKLKADNRFLILLPPESDLFLCICIYIFVKTDFLHTLSRLPARVFRFTVIHARWHSLSPARGALALLIN